MYRTTRLIRSSKGNNLKCLRLKRAGEEWIEGAGARSYRGGSVNSKFFVACLDCPLEPTSSFLVLVLRSCLDLESIYELSFDAIIL